MTDQTLSRTTGGERAERRVSGVSGVLGQSRPTLRAGTKAFVQSGGRVLLVKERRVDGSHFWSLPGGGLEADESLSECLRREISEEIQCRATVKDAVGVCPYRHISRPETTVYVVFETVLETEPEPNLAEAVVDCAWFPPAGLPPTTLDPIAGVVEDVVSGT